MGAVSGNCGRINPFAEAARRFLQDMNFLAKAAVIPTA
jgi:hypothetical protein